jgi:hypothetical protein
MQFRLLYEGPIAPWGRSSNPEGIHKIRMDLHSQLKALWRYKPLSDFTRFLRETARPGEIAIFERPTTARPLRRVPWLFYPPKQATADLFEAAH